MPAAEQRCVGQYGLVHCIRLATLKSKALTNWAGGNESGDVDEARRPVEARALKLEDSFVASVVTTCATVALANEVEVFRCDRQRSASSRRFCG